VRPAPSHISRHATEVDRSLAVPRAAANLRRHTLRAARHVGALLIVDALAFVAAQAMMRAVETGRLFSTGLTFSALAPELGGNQVAFAMALLVGTTVA